MNTKRLLALAFGFTTFLLVLFSSTHVSSYKIQPPAFYCNDPNPFQATINCTFCHSSFPAFHDTNTFVLQMGTDTQSLANVVSGVTTYTPGVMYFLRMNATTNSAIHGFEITADDTTNTGTNVTNFNILDAVTTSLVQVSYNFVTHHNATSNKQWTFTWTAPTNYEGPVTFYYAGNDGVAGDTNFGDSIFVVSKVINWSGLNGIPQITDKLSSLSVFPTVFSEQIEVSFNLKENAKVEGNIIDLNGRLIKAVLNENLSTGSFNRSFDLGGLSAGVYLLKIQVGDAFAVKKIIKD